MQVDASTTSCITDYLTDRLLFVQLWECMYEQEHGAWQETILSSLYPSDNSVCYLQKFSDDSAAVGVSVVYRGLVDHFVVWCGNNHLILNFAKSKEMVMDQINTITTLGERVEVVEGHQHLGSLSNR